MKLRVRWNDPLIYSRLKRLCNACLYRRYSGSEESGAFRKTQKGTHPRKRGIVATSSRDPRPNEFLVIAECVCPGRIQDLEAGDVHILHLGQRNENLAATSDDSA